MEMKVVVALGGNAIFTKDASAAAQQAALQQTAEELTKFIEKGAGLLLSHGNGPQVGNLLLQQEAFNQPENPALPLDTCVAMTQGSIGYWLESALACALNNKQIKREVVTLLTQVIVDEKDEAFQCPTKPIGPFLTEEEAQRLMVETQAVYREDAGRGWRKVVPSPKPIAIKEAQAIKLLMEKGMVTISCGGGGIPVTQNLKGIEAVVDKDFASACLADEVEADLFIILTGVERVALYYGQPNEQGLDHVTLAQLEHYKKAGHFAPGSMLPKIDAAMQFIQKHPEKKAIITSLEALGAIADGQLRGTIICAE